MTQRTLPECSATKSNNTKCTFKATYRCSNGHYLCVHHVLRLGGSLRRRETDRKCRLCLAAGVTAIVEWLLAPEVNEDRRSPKTISERSA